MKRTVIAGDLGGTHLRAALVDEDGHILHREEIPTPSEAEPAGILARIVGLFRAVATSGDTPPLGACIATAGLIDGARGRVLLAPNIPGFRNLDLGPEVSRALGVPAWVENDASAAALGEHRFGAGRGTRHLLHATLGTGIGGGIIVDGRLYRGARGLAGEIGHIVVDLAGPRCNCGSRGCLEAVVSGVAFAERARRLLAKGASEALVSAVGDSPPSAAALLAAARAGDPACEAEIRHGGHVLGMALGGLLNVLNPDAVTLSGGLLHMGEMLLDPLREAMHSIAYGPASGTLVKTTELGDDAGLLGAAAVAFEWLGAGDPVRA